MGNYVFRADVLIDALTANAADESSKHDIGRDIVPALVARAEAQVYDFAGNDVPGVAERERGYWRDVGTLDAYYDAHMDLISVDPIFDLYNQRLADPQLARAVFRPRSSCSRKRVARAGARLDGVRRCDRVGGDPTPLVLSPACRCTPTARSRSRSS